MRETEREQNYKRYSIELQNRTHNNVYSSTEIFSAKRFKINGKKSRLQKIKKRMHLRDRMLGRVTKNYNSIHNMYKYNY